MNMNINERITKICFNQDSLALWASGVSLPYIKSVMNLIETPNKPKNIKTPTIITADNPINSKNQSIYPSYKKKGGSFKPPLTKSYLLISKHDQVSASFFIVLGLYV